MAADGRAAVDFSIGTLLAQQAGFESVQRSAAATLAEVYQSCVTELVERVRSLCELTGRTQPSQNDLQQALSELQIDVTELYEYMQLCKERPQMPLSFTNVPVSQHLRQIRDYEYSNQVLGEDDVVLPPQYVPTYFPSFPARHSFISSARDTISDLTPAQRQKLKCDQRRQVEAGLQRLIASTDQTLSR